MRKYIAEFIGTFFLVLTVGCTVIPGAAGVIPAIAIGAVLMVMIFAGGHISGGHFNPAVTFAIFIRGRLELKDVIPVLAGSNSCWRDRSAGRRCGSSEKAGRRWRSQISP